MLFPFEWHCPDDPHAYYPAMCYNPCLDEYNPDGPNYTSYTHLEVMADVFTTDLGGEIRFETPTAAPHRRGRPRDRRGGRGQEALSR